jgi:hypothetical protein
MWRGVLTDSNMFITESTEINTRDLVQRRCSVLNVWPAVSVHRLELALAHSS